jgi:hypothetical protein
MNSKHFSYHSVSSSALCQPSLSFGVVSLYVDFKYAVDSMRMEIYKNAPLLKKNPTQILNVNGDSFKTHERVRENKFMVSHLLVSMTFLFYGVGSMHEVCNRE